MKITKLLRVVLVSEKYIVVNDGGNNRTINISDSSMYEIGDMYSFTEEPAMIPKDYKESVPEDSKIFEPEVESEELEEEEEVIKSEGD